MGYCMSQHGSEFVVRADQKPAALKAIHELMGRVDELGNGGSWQNGKRLEANFSWVDTKEVLDATTFEDAMKAWRWECQVDSVTGDVFELEFTGEKYGDDDHLFRVIAPFVRAKSYIHMEGEDGEHWKWVFDGQGFKQISGEVVFPDEDEE